MKKLMTLLNQKTATTTHSGKSKTKKPFLVVGIGASAGGLPAFTEILSHLPENPGLAIVFIQHMDPTHVSQLPALLSRVSRMPILEVTANVRVQPNHIYLISPNTDLQIDDGVLQLTSAHHREKPPFHLPIDTFLKSLANDQKENAIGVILSGTGRDGAAGLAMIKSEGGMTFVQDEISAQYPDMPKAAMAATQVDGAFSCEKIAKELLHLVVAPLRGPPKASNKISFSESEDSQLALVFDLLTKETGTDFSHYKPTTIQRRILRRMTSCKAVSLADYITVLQKDKEEVVALHKELLINLTGFFRDAEVFDFLKEKVIPEILKARAPDSSLRVWVPACSTGEEVYSLAMILLESLPDLTLKIPIQIFGSDISESVLEKARAGIYTEEDMSAVSPERRERFFVMVNGDYKIARFIRDLCVFAKQDLTSHPPFSKIDLISCRNLLIYLGLTLQNKVFSVFHYSLNPGGFLMLGMAETIGSLSELFAITDKRNKIYSRKSVPHKLPIDFLGSSQWKKQENKTTTPSLWDKFDLEKAANRMMIEKFAPPGVVVNEDMTILRFQGQMRPYLDPTAGGASLNLMKMVLEGLATDLRILMDEALKENREVKKTGIALVQNGKATRINIEVIPLLHPGMKERFFTVLFHEEKITPPKNLQKDDVFKESAANSENQNHQLRNELTLTKRHLQTIIEAEETSNQQLRITNEEILSSNEELQSTNEELETAQEELQSTNEELSTVNDELSSRNLQLVEANADLNNLFVSANLPIIMLHQDLRIRHFTPMAEKLMNLKPGDEGRLISDFKPNIDIPDLEVLILECMKSGLSQEREVQDKSGIWYLLQIRPYKTAAMEITGVVIALINVHPLKAALKQLTDAHDYSEMIVQTVLNPLIVLDADLRVVMANDSFYKNFQVTKAETVHQFIYELGDRQWNIPRLKILLEVELPQNVNFANYEIDHVFPHIGRKNLLLNASSVYSKEQGKLILISMQDITENKAAEKSKQESEEIFRTSKLRQQFAAMTSHELRTPLTAIKEGINLVLEELAGPLNDEQKENLRISQNNVDRLSSLINNLLHLTKMDSDTFRMFFAPTELNALIKEVCDSMKQIVAMKGVVLSCDLPHEEISVVCDSEKITQVIINLIDNALKFTNKGGSITIRLKQENQQIICQVSDTGIGIKEENQLKIFDIFEQARPESKIHGSGFGIGLAICRKIIEQHQGKITVRSVYGKGAQFIVSFPMNLTPSRPESH